MNGGLRACPIRAGRLLLSRSGTPRVRNDAKGPSMSKAAKTKAAKRGFPAAAGLVANAARRRRSPSTPAGLLSKRRR